MTIAERAEAAITHVCATHFPNYLPPPEPGRKGYDPLLTAIHFGTGAISRIEDWHRHIAETGPHDSPHCPQCTKMLTLVRADLTVAGWHVDEAFVQFARCQRGGCANWFHPIRDTQVYCSHACRQAAYKARRASGE